MGSVCTKGQVIRFVIVGLFATATYIGVTSLLSSSMVGLETWVASLVGFAVSLVASYVGHAHITFRVQGGHGRSGLRFAIVTLCLVVSLSWLADFLVTQYGANKSAAVFLIGALYPPASFVL